MAAPSNPHRWKYDVFVSFRGEDIRRKFMDHMFNHFKQKGIHAFRDDDKLPKGEKISPHLYKAIEESRFLIVIFSKHYASSSWCLRELVKILWCKQMGEPKHEVQIIFYDVKPDVVRKQTESYAEAFSKHQVSNKPEVDNWKEALTMAANLSGWDLQDMTNSYESKFINCISKEILKHLCDGSLHVGENLVGLYVHFDKLNLSRFAGWNFDGLASLTSNSCSYLPLELLEFLEKEVIEIQESYMIWLPYSSNIGRLKEAKNFVTFNFFGQNNEAYEVKECGVRQLCDGDSQDVASLGMFQDHSQHGGSTSCCGPYGSSNWFW